ncbi:hypothetical protein E3J59_03225 [Candidatus Aerophobetes bacterium]|uniref:Uncharacterized protein n=1 Tax=Aerophobetes bacterium TaxID=2030807 RepID=A0A523UVC5_UNCAE|nr:MAG: hypothetical protein E3J59_03225 [Candidatus Aerophobetes bacterium]
MEQITIIINSVAYGTEGPYNALRLALALNKDAAGVVILNLPAGLGSTAPSGSFVCIEMRKPYQATPG